MPKFEVELINTRTIVYTGKTTVDAPDLNAAREAAIAKAENTSQVTFETRLGFPLDRNDDAEDDVRSMNVRMAR